jgi:uncharacterized protein YdeI (YjbR/CyaY-like superfamily)
MSNQKLFLHFTDVEDWRNWLRVNYAIEREVWLIFYKNITGKQNISYEASVEEALCFGWIDSIIKTIDDESYARKFTPRTNTKNWSALNIGRIKKLISEGKMEEPGLSKLPPDLFDPVKCKILEKKLTSETKVDKTLEVPDMIISFLSKNEPALENFNALAPSYKKHYVLWITSAKTEPTIRKRLTEAATLLKENKKLGLK